MDSNSDMVYFKREDSCFNLRSACVCKRGEEILLFHFDKGGFWTLPGGRCNMHESSPEAAIREFWEEIGETVTINRLLWVIENFFDFNSTKFHELLFVYLIELPQDSKIISKDEFFAHEGEREMLCKFINPNDFSKYNVLPSIFPSILTDIPKETKHIIHHDNN
jgi:8-oxo-dGTP pyrophosphatase MutT (NUDIX family)